MSIRQKYDVIVIGGGPSGMMAAGCAAKRGNRVLLIEQNKELGKKLSVTGGGRCNIFNAEKDTHKLLENYGDASKFLYSPFSQHSMQDSWDFFQKLGLGIVVEARNRAFPKSQKATDVTNTMKKYVTDNNVEIRLNTKVLGFETNNSQITGVKIKDEVYSANSYILSTGGYASKSVTSTGVGIEWLKSIGHSVYKPSPNIVPLKVKEKWVKDISGNTLSFMKITFGIDLPKCTSDKQGKFSLTGKILFTHFGLSGPVILNASHNVQKLLKLGDVISTIDMYPDTDIGTLRKKVLNVFDKNKNKLLKNVLKEIVPSGMDGAVYSNLNDDLRSAKVHSVGKEARESLVNLIKAMPITITGTMGMDWAVISDGGVDLREVDTKTMRSRLYDNLYLTGDVLNINRPSGGYSLQLCWTTGYVAGVHA